MLLDRGFSRVRPLEGGLEAWIADGGQVTFFETGAPME
jgi:rhodanese-related sulfurtransferase